MRNLKHSKPGWIGLSCGLAAVLLFLIAVVRSFRAGGEASYSVGTIGLFGLVFAVGGLVLGILGVREEDVRPLPPRIALVVGACMSALLAGLYIYGF